MAALTADKGHDERIGVVFSYDVAAAVKIFAGSLCVLDAAGNLKPGVTGTALKCAGRAKKQVDNSAGAAAAVTAEVEEGTFRWNNSTAGDLITKADVGALCYIVDDQTVAKTSNTAARSIAGYIRAVDAGGVWVESHPYIAALVA